MPVALTSRDQITIQQTAVNTAFLRSKLEYCESQFRALSIGQEDDPQGKVPSGTIVGVVSATKMVRPVGYGLLTTDPADGNVFRCALAAKYHFRVGDVVRVYNAAGTDRAGSDRTITDIALGSTFVDITVDGASITTVDLGGSVRRVDGSQTPIGISWLDANSWCGMSDVDGNAIHQDGRPIEVLRRGRVVQSLLPYAPDALVTTLTSLGFIFE
jgi:hypothetical protein